MWGCERVWNSLVEAEPSNSEKLNFTITQLLAPFLSKTRTNHLWIYVSIIFQQIFYNLNSPILLAALVGFRFILFIMILSMKLRRLTFKYKVKWFFSFIFRWAHLKTLKQRWFSVLVCLLGWGRNVQHRTNLSTIHKAAQLWWCWCT